LEESKVKEMSKYKITVRIKTAQTYTPEQKQLVNYYTNQDVPQQNWPESIRPVQQVVDTSNTPSPGSYANSYFDPRNGETVYLNQNLQQISSPVYSTPKPSVASQASQQTMQQVDQLNKNPDERNVSNPQYTLLATNPDMAISEGINPMNPIRQRALQDQRTVREVRQIPPTYNYNQANSALYLALKDIGMENWNARDLEANQETIKNQINQRFNNNPKYKQLALALLQRKLLAAGLE
jgi:hypothetical protein